MGRDVFLSYARRDEEAVRTLVALLRRSGHDVWLDEQLTGGQDWWDEILRKIRERDVFLIALSDSSARSAACQSEYRYALELGRSVLPVEVAPIESERLLDERLGRTQREVFDPDAPASVIEVIRALDEVAPSPPADPGVPEPGLPISYLGRLRETVASSADLTFDSQRALAAQLIEEYRDPDQRAEVAAIARALLERRDVLAVVASQLRSEIVDDADDTLQSERSAERPRRRGLRRTSPAPRARRARKGRPASDGFDATEHGSTLRNWFIAMSALAGAAWLVAGIHKHTLTRRTVFDEAGFSDVVVVAISLAFLVPMIKWRSRHDLGVRLIAALVGMSAAIVALVELPALIGHFGGSARDGVWVAQRSVSTALLGAVIVVGGLCIRAMAPAEEGQRTTVPLREAFAGAILIAGLGWWAVADVRGLPLQVFDAAQWDALWLVFLAPMTALLAGLLFSHTTSSAFVLAGCALTAGTLALTTASYWSWQDYAQEVSGLGFVSQIVNGNGLAFKIVYLAVGVVNLTVGAAVAWQNRPADLRRRDTRAGR